MISRERQKHTGKPSNLNSDFYDCLKACDLEDKDLRGKSDPYAVITYEDQAGFFFIHNNPSKVKLSVCWKTIKYTYPFLIFKCFLLDTKTIRQFSVRQTIHTNALSLSVSI